MRIVFLGDSLTWGGYGGNFVQAVAERMPEHEIINAGAGGDTVVNLLNRLASVLKAHEPDAMFVMVGGNDATSYTMPRTRPYYRRTKNIEDGVVTPEQFETVYRELLYQLQLNFIQPLVGLAPTEYNRELVVAKQQYNMRAHTIAENLNIPVLDLQKHFTPDVLVERDPVTLNFIHQIGEHWRSGWDAFEEARAQWGYTYTFDGMHILPETAEEFAKHIVPFLRQHLL